VLTLVLVALATNAPIGEAQARRGVVVSLNVAGTPVYVTTADVTLEITARGAVEMRLRNEGTGWSPWRPYETRVPWSLEALDGLKRIELQVRLATKKLVGASTSVTLDTTGPDSTIVVLATWAGGGSLGFSASDALSGVAVVRYRLREAEWKEGTELTLRRGRRRGCLRQGVYAVDAYAVDIAGNAGPVTRAHVSLSSAGLSVFSP
jgi:hypothetical protein